MDEEQSKKEAIDNIKGEKFLIRPIRTYQDDVASLIKKQKISTAKIVMAEQKRKEEPSIPRTKEVEPIIVPQQQPKKAKWRVGREEVSINNKMTDQRVADVTQSVLDEPEREPIEQVITGGQILREETVGQKKVQKDRRPLPIKGIISASLIILSIVLIVGTIVFTDIESRIANILPIGEELQEENFITNEVNVSISADNRTAREIRDLIRQKIKQAEELPSKTISEIEIQKRGISPTDGSSGTQDITTTEFFRVLESSAPEGLIRSLSPDFMLGIINIDGVKPFILFKTYDLDQSYAKMFEWEPTMYRDLNDIFYSTLGLEDFYSPNPDVDPEITSFDPRALKDEILINRDTRAIIDSSGNILFFYSFIDSEHLLMTSDIEVLREIVQRLNVQRLIR